MNINVLFRLVALSKSYTERHYLLFTCDTLTCYNITQESEIQYEYWLDKPPEGTQISVNVY